MINIDTNFGKNPMFITYKPETKCCPATKIFNVLSFSFFSTFYNIIKDNAYVNR